jgi:hypothetical protein
MWKFDIPTVVNVTINNHIESNIDRFSPIDLLHARKDQLPIKRRYAQNTNTQRAGHCVRYVLTRKTKSNDTRLRAPNDCDDTSRTK